MGVGRRKELAAIGRTGENFLVAGESCVKHAFAAGLPRGPKKHALENASFFEYESGSHQSVILVQRAPERQTCTPPSSFAALDSDELFELGHFALLQGPLYVLLQQILAGFAQPIEPDRSPVSDAALLVVTWQAIENFSLNLYVPAIDG